MRVCVCVCMHVWVGVSGLLCVCVCITWCTTPSIMLSAGVIYDEDSPDIVILQEDFLVALKELEPSVSAEDLKKYDKLRHFHNQP